MASNPVEIAAIAGAHGIKGDVLIKPFGADPGQLLDYGPLRDKTGTATFTIQSLRPGRKNFLIARITEITDRNQAEAAKGTVLCIDRDQLPEPDDDEFYYSDLIGLEARLENGEPYGRVINVDDFGAGDLLEIMPQNSQTSMYLSFTKETVPHIAISEGHITIVLPSYDEVSETKDEAARPAEE